MKKTYLIVSVIVLLLVYLLFYIKPLYAKVTWTSVNICHTIQGDAHLVSKNNKHFLIDTGSHREAPLYLVPFLKKHHIDTIEAILITHPHFDHYGGVVDILEANITVKKIYMNMPTKEQMHKEWWGGEYKHLITIQKSAKKYHSKLLPIEQGLKLSFDARSFIDILYIYDGIHTPVGETSINDMSAITMLVDGKNKFILTGDLDKNIGKYLAEHSKKLEANMLKVPHHGATTLAPHSFFKAVSPKEVIVTAPKKLWCSQRCKDTRAFVKKEHYQTYVNGFHGDITVTSYNNKYIITTEKSPKELCKEGQ
jgi:competence protein ComEC